VISDAQASIAAIVAAVEVELPLEIIEEAVSLTFTKNPLALRTLATLESDPALLTNASPHVPKVLESLISRLALKGAVTVRAPECADCARPRPLAHPSPRGRICGSCYRRGNPNKTVPCSQCRRNRTASLVVEDLTLCSTCAAILQQSAAEQIARVTSELVPSAGHIDLDALEVLVDRPRRRLRLALELEVHGADWFTDPAAASVLFASYYDALLKNGVDLKPRVCGHCSSTRTLTERLEGRITCRRCYRKAHERNCDGCADRASIERVTADGLRLCQRCVNKLEDENANCVSCGRHRLIAIRTPAGPQCSTQVSGANR
jgi:hypothetical protein